MALEVADPDPGAAGAEVVVRAVELDSADEHLETIIGVPGEVCGSARCQQDCACSHRQSRSSYVVHVTCLGRQFQKQRSVGRRRSALWGRFTRALHVDLLGEGVTQRARVVGLSSHE